ncbi:MULTISPECIES: SDR family NAD(P)-dependent oxidoreductase [Exiguobacterium]|uniref:SDR family NAD(P)-dependent oxidoreductase n=1 Tax=Exiguobacterium TaxID=33986 RepID=UPI000649972E|nr:MULTISPECIES: SDR family NAD(P)-dependent oxidoreductase [Exiguobacterium]MDX5980339.1 SDR family NAD(P)-dependent oxidoreductase [Exiguobacterium profundum]
MKYTVITGASSGIGYETAKLLAEKGKSLVLVARRKEELESLRDEIKSISSDSDVIIKSTDLSYSENVYGLYESLADLDIETWINNAGFGDADLIKDVDLGKIENMIRLNIEALTVLSSLYVRDYHDVEGAQLLNVSSVGGYRIVPNSVTYCATKFFVSAYTEGLAQELKQSGAKLRAKVLAPAATETSFADRARDTEGFDYSENVAKYHTAREMAEFLYELLEGDEVVGIVDPEDYSFSLRGPIKPYAG